MGECEAKKHYKKAIHQFTIYLTAAARRYVVFVAPQGQLDSAAQPGSGAGPDGRGEGDHQQCDRPRREDGGHGAGEDRVRGSSYFLRKIRYEDHDEDASDDAR